jgi:hypothetical protein
MQNADISAGPAAIPRSGPIRQRFWRAAHAPWFSYVALALLQLHVVWGAWDYRDLTTGDTSAYFVLAHGWATDLTNYFVWSPLYTMYYGTVLWLFPDVWTATLVHRLLIVFAASLLALSVFRRLLPPGLAWLAAAWWACLPIVFDNRYEVHLFSALPVLLGWRLLLAGRGPWARGWGLAALGLGAILVRNELALAAVLTAALCLGWEIREARRGNGPGWGGRLLAYALPLAAGAGLCLGAYQRSAVRGEELRRVYNHKHTLNMAQVYSFGYQQRHPDWTRNPWIAYHELMTAHFGKELPSLTEMLHTNRGALLEHFAWNARLLPNGLELLLFNATGGKQNPDYVPVALRRPWARRLALLTLGVFAVGCLLLVWQWRRWWAGWLRPRAGGWLAVAVHLPVWAAIVATQRPRPSYLFPLGLALMAAVGTAVHVLLSQWPAGRRRLAAWAPAVMLGLCLFVRPHYGRAGPSPPQPCRAAVVRLLPFRDLIARSGLTLVHEDYLGEVTNYVGLGLCRPLGYEVIARRPPDVPLDVHLAREKVDVFHLNQGLLRRLEGDPSPQARTFLGATAPPGWELVGRGDTPGDRWRLFRRL